MQSPEVVSPIEGVETIASGRAVRIRLSLIKRFGFGNWLKRKGFGDVKLQDGAIVRAELHWYEAHGIGKRDMKIKRYMQDIAP
jgi:CRISPR/Cas system CSM-associated protein Csm3 (group 7 of RAMP superfamily)